MLVNKEPHTVSLVTEPLSSASLVTEEVADAEPFAKKNRGVQRTIIIKRKNDGKNSPTFN